MFTTTKKNELYKKVMERYGIDEQLMVTSEECAELIKECSKMFRCKGDVSHLAEEIADVLIMCEQLIKYYGIKCNVEDLVQQKLTRLSERLHEKE